MCLDSFWRLLQREKREGFGGCFVKRKLERKARKPEMESIEGVGLFLVLHPNSLISSYGKQL